MDTARAEHTRYQVWCGFKLADLARQGSVEDAAFAKSVRDRVAAPVASREPGEVAMTSPAPTAAAPCAASDDHAFHDGAYSCG